MWKANKSLKTRKLHHLQRGHWCPLEYHRGKPRLGLPHVGPEKPGQVSRHGEPHAQMGIHSQKEKRRRKDHMGKPVLSSDWSILYCLGKLFILLVVHKING